MSCLVGTGNNMWSGMYVVVSTLGLVAIYSLLQAYYIKPFHVSTWWYLGLLFMLSMVAAVVILGGIVVLLWHWAEKRNLKHDESVKMDNERIDLSVSSDAKAHSKTEESNLVNLIATRYGCRPDFQGNDNIEMVIDIEGSASPEFVSVLIYLQKFSILFRSVSGMLM